MLCFPLLKRKWFIRQFKHKFRLKFRLKFRHKFKQVRANEEVVPQTAGVQSRQVKSAPAPLKQPTSAETQITNCTYTLHNIKGLKLLFPV